jgi:hypothetical protein
MMTFICRFFLFCWALVLLPAAVLAQRTGITPQTDERKADSLYIAETEDQPGPPKVLHVEPLFVDLIRDLGARKGEWELNLAGNFTDNIQYNQYEGFVEYEWAPIDRLGLEVEVPFSIYTASPETAGQRVPGNRVESLNLGLQWTVLVSEKWQTSLALGYANELQLVDLKEMRATRLLKGNVYNPLVVAAKRWGKNWHTLVISGGRFEQDFTANSWDRAYELNSNVHYMVPGTRNFVGLEVNKLVENGQLEAVFRPQVKLAISETLRLGFLVGIPYNRPGERLSTFFRFVYEP